MRIVKVTRLPRDKDAQVDITVREMIRITCTDAWNPCVRWLAVHWKLLHYRIDEIAESYTKCVSRAVAFELDPEDIELLRTPSYYARNIRAHRRPSGDCDDLALLLGTLLWSQGIRIAYVVMSTSPLNPEFRHVFVAANLGGNRWQAYDPSVTRPYTTDGLRRRWYYVPHGPGSPPA